MLDAEAEAEEAAGSFPQQNQEAGQGQAGAHLLHRAEMLAEKHKGYSTLTALCEHNGDAERLYTHMLR